MITPAWMSGSFDLGHLTITYSRLWIIFFALGVLAALMLFLKRTHFGLEMRAVTQNRSMAVGHGRAHQLGGCAHLRSGLGRGGIAGVALSQIDNVSPNLGQTYIIDSFMVVVFGGVGNLWGTLVGADDAGRRQQVARALCGRGGRQDPGAGLHHPVHAAPAARSVRPQGPGGGSMIARPSCSASVFRGALYAVLAALAVLVPLLNLLVPESWPIHVSTFMVTLLGKYLCYALLALALDLVWGYCGILSLGHGAFFALGGYAMGMHLMRMIGPRGVYGDPVLPDFMVFLNWKELPWYWLRLRPFPFAMLMVVLAPGLLAFVFGCLAFRSARHRRLSVHHHPGDDLRADAGLFPQRYGLWRQ